MSGSLSTEAPGFKGFPLGFFHSGRPQERGPGNAASESGGVHQLPHLRPQEHGELAPESYVAWKGEGLSDQLHNALSHQN